MRHNKYSEYKIVFFPEKIESFVEQKIAAPIYVRVKPTNLCNHNCFFCVYASGYRREETANVVNSGMHEDIDHSDVIPTEKMMEILEDFRDIGVRAVTYSGGGEPLMHRDIVPIMRRTLEYGLDLSIITNGQLLTKDRAEVLRDAKWVRISMDYTNPDELVKQRGVSGGSFGVILNNIENFAKVKKGGDLAVNFIVHQDNYKSLFDFAKILKNCGVENVRFSPMWVPEFTEYHEPIADAVNEQLARAGELVDSTFSVNTSYNISAKSFSPDRPYHKCFFMQIVPVIGADQLVYTCHNKAYDKTGVLGSVRSQRFRELWFSDEMKKVMDEFDAKTRCQHQCANDSKNVFIHGLVDAQYDNFV